MSTGILCTYRVPFRMVDEINQGMDERNERLVFDRIVSSCCSSVDAGANGTLSSSSSSSSSAPSTRPLSQYFLVSPKLLPSLRAMQHDDVTVLLVLNGSGCQLNFLTYLQHVQSTILSHEGALPALTVDAAPSRSSSKTTAKRREPSEEKENVNEINTSTNASKKVKLTAKASTSSVIPAAPKPAPSEIIELISNTDDDSVREVAAPSAATSKKRTMKLAPMFESKKKASTSSSSSSGNAGPIDLTQD